MDVDIEKTRLYFNSLDMSARYDFIDQLSPESYRYLRYFTDVFCWDKQIIPNTDDWKYYLMCGGRGSSKTWTLCHDAAKRLKQGQEGMMIVGPTYEDINDVLVPTLLDMFPDDYPATYNGNKRQLIAPNGKFLSFKSSEIGIIKGRNTTICYIDELSECWSTSDKDKQLNYWRVLDGNIRKGNAQMIMSSNPETTPIFRHLWDLQINSPNIIKIISSSIHENPYLDPIKKAAYIKQWTGTRYEKMQLLGIMDWSQDGALWSMQLINATRVKAKVKTDVIGNKVQPTFKENLQFLANPIPQRAQFQNPLSFFWRFVIAIDPAMSVSENSDETGIIIAAMGRDNHVYILEDLSGKYMPDDLAEIVHMARQRYPNLKVIVETNNGGHFVTNALRTKDQHIDANIISIKVSDSKMTRAQHIVILWDNLTAHIVGDMPKLEQQMVFYTGQANQKSPDRFDAMAMACQHLAFDLTQPTFNANSMPHW